MEAGEEERERKKMKRAGQGDEGERRRRKRRERATTGFAQERVPSSCGPPIPVLWTRAVELVLGTYGKLLEIAAA